MFSSECPKYDSARFQPAQGNLRLLGLCTSEVGGELIRVMVILPVDFKAHYGG